MNNKIAIEIEASVTMTLGNKKIAFHITPKKKSKIVTERLLSKEDIPEDFSEIVGFERIDNETSDIATMREVLLISHAIIPQMFLISIGKPIIFGSTRKLAAYSEKIYKNKFDVTILRGSLRADNPYEPLQKDFGPYTDKDSHIVMLSRIQST